MAKQRQKRREKSTSSLRKFTHHQDRLISPRVLELAEKMRDGHSITNLPTELVTFIESGCNSTKLAEILTVHPSLLAHEVVWDQVGHLWRIQRDPLLHQNDDEDIEAAFDALRTIVEGWMGGILPGWTLKPPAKRRGRKLSQDEQQFHSLLVQDYEDTLAKLKKYKTELLPQETDEAWQMRWIGIVEKIWRESALSKFLSFERVPNTSRLLKDNVIPLPKDRARQWVEDAYRKLEDKLGVRDYLAYCLLGNRWNLKPDQVRGYIQRERKRIKS